MKILVTTPRFVLGHDTDTSRTDVIATGSRYYGLSWSPDGRVLALAHGGYEGEMNNLAQYAMSDVGYVTLGARRSMPFLSAPHQLLWVDDDGVAVANTGRNAIARVAAGDFSVVQQRYDAAIWDRYDATGERGNHYNSVYYDGRHLYAVAHNFLSESFVVKAEWPSLALVERIPVAGAFGVHNLWIDEKGRWVTCFSHQGALIDARTGEWLWDCRGMGLTRGLAATDDWLFVGYSEIAPRDKREFTRSGLWVIDRHTMKLERLVFLGHFGGVHDVRIASERDACHPRAVLADDALRPIVEETQAFAAETGQRATVHVPDAAQWERRLGLFLDESGRLVPRGGDFSLMTRRGSEQFTDGVVSARLHVHTQREGHHAALVVRYGGPEDLRQYAAIFQGRGSSLSTSLWVEDDGWRSLGAAAVPDRFLRGIDMLKAGIPIELAVKGDVFRISVSGHEILQVRDGAIAQGAVGLRVVGTSYAISHFHWRAA